MSEFQVTGEMIHYVMIHCVCVCVCRSKLWGLLWDVLELSFMKIIINILELQKEISIGGVR